MQWYKFAIFDSKTNTSNPPYYSPSRGAGIRTWHFNVNKAGTDYNNYPGDYTLFELGTYEGDTMDDTNYETKKNHGLAVLQLNKEELT